MDKDLAFILATQSGMYLKFSTYENEQQFEGLQKKIFIMFSWHWFDMYIR